MKDLKLQNNAERLFLLKMINQKINSHCNDKVKLSETELTHAFELQYRLKNLKSVL